jgi:hypothetical protein
VALFRFFRLFPFPLASTTVRDVVEAFVDYLRAHPEHLSQEPMDVVFRAGSEQWPCS